MSISSTSSFNPYAATSDLRASSSSRRFRADDGESKAAQRSGAKPGQDGVRPQRLEQALMSALQGLGFSSDTVASTEPVAIDTGLPGTGTTTTSDSTSKTDPTTLKQAVHAFAHELAQALRGSGEGDRSGRKQYGDFSQRLEHLSEKLAGDDATPVQPIKVGPGETPNGDAPIILVAAPPVSPSTSDTKDAPIKVEPVATPVQTTPVDKHPILVTPETDATATAAVAVDTKTTKDDKLLSAFTDLFDKLQGAQGGTTTKVDYAAKLKEFLGSLSQAFSPREAMPISTPGGLLNLTA